MRLPKRGISRFHYHECAGVDPLSLPYEQSISDSAHKRLSKDYEKRFRAGDKNAIFEYAKKDALADKAPWIGVVRSQWIEQGTPEALRAYKKLNTSLLASKGKRLPSTLINIIELDQKAFKYALERQKKGAPIGASIMDAASHLNMSEESARKIYKYYRRLLERKVLASPYGVTWEKIKALFRPYSGGRIGLPEILSKKDLRAIGEAVPRPLKRMKPQTTRSDIVTNLKKYLEEYDKIKGKKPSARHFLSEKGMVSDSTFIAVVFESEEDVLDWLSLCLDNLRKYFG